MYELDDDDNGWTKKYIFDFFVVVEAIKVCLKDRCA